VGRRWRPKRVTLLALWDNLPLSNSPLDRMPRVLYGPWEAHSPRLAATRAEARDGGMAPRNVGQHHAQRTCRARRPGVQLGLMRGDGL
jgi:hypothetical protein